MDYIYTTNIFSRFIQTPTLNQDRRVWPDGRPTQRKTGDPKLGPRDRIRKMMAAIKEKEQRDERYIVTMRVLAATFRWFYFVIWRKLFKFFICGTYVFHFRTQKLKNLIKKRIQTLHKSITVNILVILVNSFTVKSDRNTVNITLGMLILF